MTRNGGEFKRLLALAATGESLTEDQAGTAFDLMMSGDATPSQMGAFLMALRGGGAGHARQGAARRGA